MHTLRLFSIFAWLAIPTVMYGDYAHAGVLLLMALLYHNYMEQTSFPIGVKVGAAVVVLVGVLAQSGGFFLHMAIGQPGAPSLGTTITTIGAALLAGAILLLVYGLITAKPT